MKRLLVLGAFVLLCVVPFCVALIVADDRAVDVNAPTHKLEDFKNKEIFCHVKVETSQKTTATATGAESTETEKKPATVIYEFSEQEAVDIYNLLDRANWKNIDDNIPVTGTFTQMLTLDFYAGRSVENAKAYYGSFVISNQDRLMASEAPFDLSIMSVMVPPGTYEAVYDYIIEHGEVNS